MGLGQDGSDATIRELRTIRPRWQLGKHPFAKFLVLFKLGKNAWTATGPLLPAEH